MKFIKYGVLPLLFYLFCRYGLGAQWQIRIAVIAVIVCSTVICYKLDKIYQAIKDKDDNS